MTKPTVATEAKVPCITCGRECPDGLRYCLYCGGKTLEIDKPVMPADPHCSQCGEEDELNIAFCVNCGAKLAWPDGLEEAKSMIARASATAKPTQTRATAAKLARKTGFNWTLEDSPPAAIRMAMRAESEPSIAAPAAPLFDAPTGVVPSVIGVIVGLGIAATLFFTGILPDIVAKLAWPQTGLVVYCPQEPDALQFSLENLSSHILTVTTVPGDAASFTHAPRLCILRDLPKGDYLMRVEKSGGSSSFGLVTLSDSGPTVVGHPAGIKLQD